MGWQKIIRGAVQLLVAPRKGNIASISPHNITFNYYYALLMLASLQMQAAM
jgi:hypothetical protein